MLAEKIRNKLVRGRPAAETDATVAQMLERYLDRWEGDDSFLDVLRSYVRRHVNPIVGTVKVHK